MFECLFQSLLKTDSPKRDSQMEREQNTNDKKEQREKKENDSQMCWNWRIVMKMERLEWEKDICMVMQGGWLFSYLDLEGCSSFQFDNISNQLNNTQLLKMSFT